MFKLNELAKFLLGVYGCIVTGIGALWFLILPFTAVRSVMVGLVICLPISFLLLWAFSAVLLFTINKYLDLKE